jgi:hypothetical protein
MPEHGAVLARNKGRKVPVVALLLVHDVDFGVAFGDAGCWVDVVSAKVATKSDCLLHGDIGKVLVAEDEDFALGSEEGELVLAGVCKGGQLESGYLGARRGRQLLESYSWEKKILQRWIGVFAWVMMCKGL